MEPVRVVMLGGPYDGHVWFPQSLALATVWATEHPADPLMDHTVVDQRAAPQVGTFVDEDQLVVQGPLGEEMYLWSHDDVWMHDTLWFSEDLLGEFEPVPEFEGCDG